MAVSIQKGNQLRWCHISAPVTKWPLSFGLLILATLETLVIDVVALSVRYHPLMVKDSGGYVIWVISRSLITRK